MKKLLPLLLAVLLIVSLSVSAMAAETLEFPSLPDTGKDYWVIYLDGKSYIALNQASEFTTETSYGNNYFNATKADKYTLTDGLWASNGTISTRQSVTYAKYHSSGTIVSNEGVTFVCTGATCPATDVNHDNVCDDCAMTFAVMRDYSVTGTPEGWPASVPAPPSQYNYMTLFTEEGETWLYMTDYEPTIQIRENADEGTFTLWFTMPDTSAKYNLQRYHLIDGVWSYNSVGSLRDFTLDESLNFLYSTKDIYDIYGDRFFPIPLWGQVGQVTQRETESLYHQTMGTMGILVPCGIGLLTLLVALVLLAKKFRLFLP